MADIVTTNTPSRTLTPQKPAVTPKPSISKRVSKSKKTGENPSDKGAGNEEPPKKKKKKTSASQTPTRASENHAPLQSGAGNSDTDTTIALANALKRLEKMEAQMNRTDVQNLELHQWLNGATKAQSATPKSKAKPNKRKQSTHKVEEDDRTVEKTSDEVTGGTGNDRASNIDEVAALKAALALEREKNAKLTTDLDSTKKKEPRNIPKPKGSVGNDWNLQKEMGLAGSAINQEKYKTIMQDSRDLWAALRMDVAIPFKDQPIEERAKLLSAMHQRHPLLANFIGDWASITIINSYTGGKRGRLYAKEILPVPQKYTYLKRNAEQRDQSKPRVSRVKLGNQASEGGKSKESNGDDESSDEEDDEGEDEEEEA